MSTHLSPLRTITAIAAAAALTLAACGGVDEPSSGDTAVPEDSAPAASSPATDPASSGGSEPAGGATITISGFAFGGVTEVAVGTTVTVVNDDNASHTWTADDGAFDSGGLGKGDSFEFTFTEPGTYGYHCNIHPGMTGTIVVTG